MQRREQVRRSPVAAYVAAGVAVVGFALILLAWSAAAGLSAEGARLPLLMAGGLIGLGLVAVGAAIMIIETVRRDAEMRTIELGRLEASLRVLRTALGDGEEEPAAAEPGAYRPDPRSGRAAPGDQTVELGRLRPDPGR